MRVVFMGTPSFAVPSLRALHESHDVVAAYTRPDRVSGRGRRPSPPPVKRLAEELHIPVVQPRTLRDTDEVRRLADLAPDVVCVAAFGALLPKSALGIPPLGSINVHASLLPAYRGAAPIQRAILDGAETTGVSIMRMVEELDAGPYAAQVQVPVGRLSTDELAAVLADLGADALLDVLKAMETGTAVWVAQDDSRATYAPKITADDVALTPDLTAEEADRRVRAASRSAPCRASVEGVRLTVLRASPSPERLRPGSVRALPAGPLLGLAKGSLLLEEVKPEGRRAMPGDAFLRGARLSGDGRWGAWE